MPYLSLLKKVYHISEIVSKTYQKGNKDWLFMKYYHSLDVMNLGQILIESEPCLSSCSKEEKQTMLDALLLHDIGRAFEKDEQGITIPHFLHGAEGMHYLKSHLNVQNVALLASIMVHDRMDFDFLISEEKALLAHPLMKNLSNDARQSVLDLNKAFHQLEEGQKAFVFLVSHLVKDADTLANIQVFKKLLNYSKAPTKAIVSPAVFQSINQRSYVDYQDIQTLADHGLVYFGWMYHFYFNATRTVAKKFGFAEEIKTYVLSTLREATNENSNDILAVETKYNKAISLLNTIN